MLASGAGRNVLSVRRKLVIRNRVISGDRVRDMERDVTHLYVQSFSTSTFSSDSPISSKSAAGVSPNVENIRSKHDGFDSHSEGKYRKHKPPHISPAAREIFKNVAEPEIRYDAAAASARLYHRPTVWISRNFNIFLHMTLFVGKVLVDIITKTEKENRAKRANQLLDLFSNQSPALIKAGQFLSSRSDLLPTVYLEALQKLQDRCPPYPTEQAMKLYEAEINKPFNEVFELESPEPVAAASIGQVYKATLKMNGAKVAIKIQRPNCESSVSVDLFIMRWYAGKIQYLFSLVHRSLDLIAVIDDFGELLYRELDYRAELQNAQRFSQLYGSCKDVHVPGVYPALSTSKVLVMDWVDGVRLSDVKGIKSMGLHSSHFIDTLVQCSMRQMLENGFFHADPHGGNLLAMSSGKLCYLDFGMVSYVEPAQRYSIIEAVVHMVNRDFWALAELYRKMGFIPPDVDIAPIVKALERALPDVLNAGVGDFNFKVVVAKLGDVMYKFPFTLPPYYIAIIRCLGVLEGLAIQVDKDFRIIRGAYPFIASRLLTDPSPELQDALLQLLFKGGEVRYDRLQDLLTEAAEVSDYDVMKAVDRVVEYLSSAEGDEVRRILVREAVEMLDKLETDTVQLLLHQNVLVRSLQFTPVLILREFLLKNEKNGGRLEGLLNGIVKRIAEEIERQAEPDSAVRSALKAIEVLGTSRGISTSSFVDIVKKVLRDPVLSAAFVDVTSELSARLTEKLKRRLLGEAHISKQKYTANSNSDFAPGPTDRK